MQDLCEEGLNEGLLVLSSAHLDEFSAVMTGNLFGSCCFGIRDIVFNSFGKFAFNGPFSDDQ